MSIERLQDNYEKLFENDKRYDVIIYAGENENVKEMHTLSNILCFRSQYFYDELNKENVEKKEGKFILKLPKIPPNILNYLKVNKFDKYDNDMNQITNISLYIRFI